MQIAKRFWIVGITTVLVLATIIFSGDGSLGINDSTPPTPMASDVQPDDIYDALNCYNCTSAQRKQLVNEFIGKRVRWTERVSDVDENGSVHVVTSLLRFVLLGIPRSEANALRVNDEITFEGTLSSPSNNDRWWEVQNARIIPEPTPIPLDAYGLSMNVNNQGFAPSERAYSVDLQITNNSEQSHKICVYAVAVIYSDDSNDKFDSWETPPPGRESCILNISPGEHQIPLLLRSGGHKFETTWYPEGSKDVKQMCIMLRPVRADGSVNYDENIDMWEMVDKRGRYCYSSAWD